MATPSRVDKVGRKAEMIRLRSRHGRTTLVTEVRSAMAAHYLLSKHSEWGIRVQVWEKGALVVAYL